MLKYSPHPFDVLGCISPISFCIESAEKQFLLQAVLDRGDGARNFAGDESFAATRAFVIEQNAVARTKAIAFAVVDRCPIGKRLRNTIWAARPERCLLGLRYLLCLAKHFAAGCLIKTRTQSSFFFFNDTATTEIYTLSLHDALPI